MKKRSKLIVSLAIGALNLAAFGVPAGCFFPDYSFDKNSGGNGGGGNGTGNGVSTASSQGGNAGGGGDNAGGCTCVEAAPSGWTGFFTLFDGTNADDPGCPALYPDSDGDPAGGDIDAPPADCSSYKCSDPTGGTCGATPKTFSVDDAACGAQGICTGVLNIGAANSCNEDTYLPSVMVCGDQGPDAGANCATGTSACNKSVSVAATPASGGTCATCGGTPKLTTATFKTLGRSCGGGTAVTPNSCNPGQTCQPNAGSPYSGICVKQEGDLACPLSKFSVKHTFFGGMSAEGRGCSDCTCGAASHQTCGFTLDIYQQDPPSGCGSAPIATLHGGDCVALSGNPPILAREISAIETEPSGGSCSHSGGEPTGTIEGTMPITFCCTK